MVMAIITYEFFNSSQKMVISEMKLLVFAISKCTNEEEKLLILNEPSKIDCNNNVRSNVLNYVDRIRVLRRFLANVHFYVTFLLTLCHSTRNLSMLLLWTVTYGLACND